MAVLLITRVISVRLANPLRPATTQLMSAAPMDVRLTVLAARLAKLANRLLPDQEIVEVHQHRQRLLTAIPILVRQDTNQALAVRAIRKQQQHPKYVLAGQRAAEPAINVSATMTANPARQLLRKLRLAPVGVIRIGTEKKPNIFAAVKSATVRLIAASRKKSAKLTLTASARDMQTIMPARQLVRQ